LTGLFKIKIKTYLKEQNFILYLIRPVPVPQPYAVHVPVPRPVPVPVQVPVPVDRPFPVHVDRPVPVPIDHPVKIIFISLSFFMFVTLFE
jgi:hypothetical protein